MAGLDELDLAVGTVKGAEHAVDAVAGIAEDFCNAPGVKALNQKIAYSLTYVYKPRPGPARRGACRPTGCAAAGEALGRLTVHLAFGHRGQFLVGGLFLVQRCCNSVTQSLRPSSFAHEISVP